MILTFSRVGTKGPPHWRHADTFGSKFDPYLSVPSRAVKVHAGYDAKLDSYSAFGARELSTEKSLLDTLRVEIRATLSSSPRPPHYAAAKETLNELINEVTQSSRATRLC